MSYSEEIDKMKQKVSCNEDSDCNECPYIMGDECLLDLYQKEKMNSSNLSEQLNKEKEKNKELENADLTTVYMNGFYDGEKKWKDKIKDKVEYIRFMVDDDNKSIEIVKEVNKYLDYLLQELLEERN